MPAPAHQAHIRAVLPPLACSPVGSGLGQEGAAIRIAIDAGDDSLPLGVVRLAAAHPATVALGGMFNSIELAQGTLLEFLIQESSGGWLAWPFGPLLGRSWQSCGPMLGRGQPDAGNARDRLYAGSDRPEPGRPLGLLQPIADGG